MFWYESMRVGFKGLAIHKVRTALSMTGIVFGVASVVAVVAVAEGGKQEVLRLLETLGAANIVVEAQNFEHDHEKAKAVRRRSKGLTLAEAEYMGENLPVFVAYAPMKHLRPYGKPVNVRRDEQSVSNPAVVGTFPSYVDVMGFKLREGRFLNDEDERLTRRVCVIEEDVRRELWPTGSSLGGQLFIDNEPYQVVGVLEPKHTGEGKFELASDPSFDNDGAGGQTVDREPSPDVEQETQRRSEVDKLWEKVVDEKELNKRIYIPLSCALSRTTQSRTASEIDEVIYRARTVDDLPVAKDLIIRFLTAKHSMSDFEPQDRDFKVQVAMDLIRQTQENQRIFNWVMRATAGISLLVGGIGIMNIMLANVTERRREVGIRRAVGATEGDVLRQFIVEAVGICLVGAIIGIVFGYGLSWLVSLLAGYKTAFALWGVFVALIVSFADGLAFGIYPAYKAAKLDPIEALRLE
jgi:putative ABC transport system permease protein